MTFKEWWKYQEENNTDIWNEASEYAAEEIWDMATQVEQERCAKVREDLVESLETLNNGSEFGDWERAKEEAFEECVSEIRKGTINA